MGKSINVNDVIKSEKYQERLQGKLDKAVIIEEKQKEVEKEVKPVVTSEKVAKDRKKKNEAIEDAKAERKMQGELKAKRQMEAELKAIPIAEKNLTAKLEVKEEAEKAEKAKEDAIEEIIDDLAKEKVEVSGNNYGK